MSNQDELSQLRKAALKSQREAFITSDGKTLVVSFTKGEVHTYTGHADFGSMTLTEINEFVARMDRK